MLLKPAVIVLLLCTASVFPVCAAKHTCTYKGSQEALLESLNKMDEVSDVDKNKEGSDYIGCLIKVREDSLRMNPKVNPPLTKLEEKIVQAYYAIYDRDPKYRNAIGFDSSLG